MSIVDHYSMTFLINLTETLSLSLKLVKSAPNPSSPSLKKMPFTNKRWQSPQHPTRWLFLKHNSMPFIYYTSSFCGIYYSITPLLLMKLFFPAGIFSLADCLSSWTIEKSSCYYSWKHLINLRLRILEIQPAGIFQVWDSTINISQLWRRVGRGLFLQIICTQRWYSGLCYRSHIS